MPDPIFGNAVAEALAELPAGLDALGVATRLRRDLTPELARRAAELHALRARAQADHGPGRLPFLTRKGLEQASPRAVAEERAARLARLLGPRFDAWDAACGLGSDALALLQAGARVLASDRDELTATYARANLRCAAGPDRPYLVMRAEAQARPVRTTGVLVLDPDRRAGGGRGLDPARWSPSLDAALDLAARFPAAAVRIAPGFDPGALESLLRERGASARLQWVSRRRELIELNLFLGALSTPDPALCRAAPDARELLALDSQGRVARFAGLPTDAPVLEGTAAARVTWLADPDPGLSASGLIGAVAETEGLARLGPDVAFLGGTQRPDSPFLSAWSVLGSAPLDRRRIRALLQAHDVGPLSVKTRRSREGAQSLARRLRGPGSRPGVLAVAPAVDGMRGWLLQGPGGVGDEGFEPPTSSV